jgi:Flp pilus assembly protein TadB
MEVVAAAVSAAIALAALVVSIVVARRQTEIQERLAAVEEARRAEEVEARGRARVVVSIQHEKRGERGRDEWLVLHNEGPALARDALVEVEKKKGIPDVIGLGALPVDLQPGQSMRFILTVAMGEGPKMPVTVRWTDSAGNHEELWTLLTF